MANRTAQITSDVTTVILTLNEQQRIGRCVSSVAFSKKLVLIDSFSADATVANVTAAWLAAGRASEDLVIVSQAWQGFQKTRELSRTDWVNTDWVLWIDADEWVSPELAESIERVTKSTQPLHDTYRMPRLSYFLGRPIYHGGWYPDRKTRLGLTQKCAWSLGPRGADVHEELVANSKAPPGLLEGHIFHEPFCDVTEQRDTNLRYSNLLARGLATRRLTAGKGAYSSVRVAAKVGIKFIENYVFKAGFLDGKPGLLIALGSAQSLYWRLTSVNRMLAQPEGASQQ